MWLTAGVPGVEVRGLQGEVALESRGSLAIVNATLLTRVWACEFRFSSRLSVRDGLQVGAPVASLQAALQRCNISSRGARWRAILWTIFSHDAVTIRGAVPSNVRLEPAV